MENFIIALGCLYAIVFVIFIYVFLCNIDIVQYKKDKKYFEKKYNKLLFNIKNLKKNFDSNNNAIAQLFVIMSKRISILESKIKEVSKKVNKK